MNQIHLVIIDEKDRKYIEDLIKKEFGFIRIEYKIDNIESIYNQMNVNTLCCSNDHFNELFDKHLLHFY